MSASSKAADSLDEGAQEQAEKIDPAERKMSDLLGMDKQEDETSRETPNNPPQDESLAEDDQPG